MVGRIGESGGKFEDVTLTGRIAELRAASKFVMDYFGVREIAPVGISFGGVTALYAANDPGVVCTVISSAPVDFEFFKSIENTTEDADGLLDLGGMKVKRALVGVEEILKVAEQPLKPAEPEEAAAQPETDKDKIAPEAAPPHLTN